MTDVSARNFGYLVAYVIPGFTVVAAAGFHSPVVRSWLGTAPPGPTVGGFLYVPLASVAAGMAVSALRWLILDTIHHHTGVARPNWDLSLLPGRQTAFESLVEYHYRHYLFYGNGLVALIVSLAALPQAPDVLPGHPFLTTALVAGVLILFFIASRDVLRKYYERTNSLLPTSQSHCTEKEDPMVNGCHSADDDQKRKKENDDDSASTAANGSRQPDTQATKQRLKTRPVTQPNTKKK